ncbi:hypothetical protein PMAYCL1PPCAC_18758, partial [Pristionchus mayeri]
SINVKMIIPLPLIVSLLLFSTCASEHVIDWDRCGASEDTSCFIRESCSNYGDGDNVLLYFNGDKSQLKTGSCSAAIQVKSINDKQFFVVIRLEGDDITDATELKIEQNSKIQVECKKDNAVTVNADLFNEVSDGKSKFDTGKFV